MNNALSVRAPVTDYERMRHKKLMTRFLAFILCLLLTVPVFAATPNLALMMFDDISGYSESNGQVSVDTGEDIKNVVAVNFADPGGNSGDSTLDAAISSLTADGGIVDKINNACMGVALALSIAIFCVSWMQAYLNGTPSDEVWVQKFALFGMSVAGVVLARQLTLLVATVGSGIAESISTSSLNTPSSETIKTLRETIQSTTEVDEKITFANITVLRDYANAWRHEIGYIGILVLPWLVKMLCQAIVYFVAYTRAIEVMIVAAMSPFGFIDVERGFDGPMRFVKQAFVLGIQGAIIMAVVVICQNLMVSALAGIAGVSGDFTFGDFWQLIIVCIIEAGLVSRARSIAQTVVG